MVGRRVNELGTTEPIIQRQGADRILVQVPGLQDPQRLKEILGQTAKLTFQMVDQSMPVQDALNGRPPAGSSVLYSQDDPPVPYLIEDRVIVSGENLVDAQATFDQRTNEPVVSFRFDSQGRASASARRRSRMSASLFAIILDNQVISAPQIREPILGGTGQISGNFTAAERQRSRRAAARRRAAGDADGRRGAHGRSGPRPDSIQRRQDRSASSARSCVVAFMFVAYGFLGFFANIALVVHVVDDHRACCRCSARR